MECSDPYPALVKELKTALIQGRTVLFYVDKKADSMYSESDLDKAFMSKLLRRQFDPPDEEGKVLLSLPDDSSTPVHPDLQLYLVVRETVKRVAKSDGSRVTISRFLNTLGIASALDGSVVDLELKKKALEKSLQKFVMAHERPEYLISYRSLLTDLTLHEQALEVSQEAMLKYTLANESLLKAPDLPGAIRESKASEVAALEQIREAKMNLHVSEQVVVPYRPLSHYASVMLSSTQLVAMAMRYFSLSVEEFREVLSRTIWEFKHIKVADHAMSVKAHVIHLQDQLLLSICQKLQVPCIYHLNSVCLKYPFFSFCL